MFYSKIHFMLVNVFFKKHHNLMPKLISESTASVCLIAVLMCVNLKPVCVFSQPYILNGKESETNYRT